MNESKLPWYALDIAVYLIGIIALAIAVGRIAASPESISVITLAALALATYRLADVVSLEEVTKVIRAPFAGYTTGFRGAVAKGIRCPSCTGVWSAAILLALVLFFPTAGLVPIYALALSATERLISRIVNALEKKAPKS